ncbi:MAG: CDP-alcohol phosphatidyltransferase family protein [Ilumatobacter sp.]|uniref:CDP-alcohol phosphatidyltransferase family protein n=1 Tax=Ilumatobacter sp. TaxID=1967498 RepID=UPI003C740CB5
MLDSTLRPVKDRLLRPLARTAIVRVHPTVISLVGLLLSIGAAVAASQRLAAVAVAAWLAGRLADGLDGLAARTSGRASDLGGLLDFTFDTIGYATIPIGLAFGVDTRTGWIVTAALLAAFYLNSVSLGYVAALLEKRGLDAATQRRATSAVLPRGLVEGTETIVFFTLALAFIESSPWIWSAMAALVTVTALERVRWAARELT